MELEKATIWYEIKNKKEVVQVLFNPTEYRLNKANQFAEVAIPGLGTPPLQFVRGNARTLSMQLFFDTYEQGSDVREHTQKIMKLLEIHRELHAPPVCHFNWGRLDFAGVLERADQRFTLFLPDGTPVRATVDVSFKEYCEAQKQAGNLQSADFTKRYVVKRGDTLNRIAHQEYGDPGLWRPIAQENRMDDPLALRPGQVLVIPALE
ncbi:MAG: LysM peptidoglycan-binding domain-containing protein [Deltaproteobacteria bacterium]|nr:LysM peptidoglycan-binding domain-containing protein [Deltaproteobacteria bacterium]MBW2121337.1 LysM peptidoglycan-binding domain-containing protein [Deltaproteobacteria bacterium]